MSWRMPAGCADSFVIGRTIGWFELEYLIKVPSCGIDHSAFHEICWCVLKSCVMDSIALLNRDGCFVWVDDKAPWGLCKERVLGTPAWDWVTSDNLEAVKTAYARCLTLGEPQRFQAEISIDGRSVDSDVWLHPTELTEARIIATSIRLPSRVRLLTDSERNVLRLIGEGIAPKAIAGELHVTRATIDSHRRNIMKKLRIDDAHKLQAFAVRKRMMW